jgi:hypothetical protein
MMRARDHLATFVRARWLASGLTLASILGVASAPAEAAWTDVLLNNGDRVTSEVKVLERGGP